MSTITLPRNPRERMYYPIIIPLDQYGQGPCSIEPAVKITWEVWDQFCTSFGSFEFLPDAIEFAESKNEEYHKKEETA